MKKKGTLIFNIVVLFLSTCLIMYFVFSKNGLADILRSQISFNKAYLFFAFMSMVAFWGFDTLITFILAKSLHNNFNVRNAIKISMLGQFYSAITPMATGGQPMQIYEMTTQGVSTGNATSVLIKKFYIYQCVLVGYSLLVLIFSYSFFQLKVAGLLFMSMLGFCVQAAAIVAIILFSTKPRLTKTVITAIIKFLGKIRIIKKVEQRIDWAENQLILFHNNNIQFKKKKKLTYAVGILTFFQLTSYFVVPYFIYKAFSFSEPINLFHMISANALVFMISAYVPLPGASLATEGSFVIFFKLFFGNALIKPATLIWRVITYYFAILFSMHFAALSKHKTKNQKEISEK